MTLTAANHTDHTCILFKNGRYLRELAAEHTSTSSSTSVTGVQRLCSTVLSDYSTECPFPTGLAALLIAIKKSLSGFTTTGELAVSICKSLPLQCV
jgi:hypothetical protein